MRSITTILVLIILAGIGAIITKPTDEECLQLVKSKINSDIYNSSTPSIVNTFATSVVNLGVNSMLFRVEDKLLYKDIYFKLDNSKVGTILFGYFMPSGSSRGDNQQNSTVRENDLQDQDKNTAQTTEKNTNNKTDNQNAQQSPIEWPKEISWITFHHKYGFSIDLPDFFTKGSLTASGLQYFDNSLSDEITVFVASEGSNSADDIRSLLEEDLRGRNKITYKLLKDNWYVITGHNDDGSSFYIKSILKNGNIYYLQIDYGVKDELNIEPLIGRIQSSFK